MQYTHKSQSEITHIFRVLEAVLHSCDWNVNLLLSQQLLFVSNPLVPNNHGLTNWLCNRSSKQFHLRLCVALTSLGIAVARTEYCSNIVFSQNVFCCLSVSQSVCLFLPHSPTFPSGVLHQCAAETCSSVHAELQLGMEGGGGETAFSSNNGEGWGLDLSQIRIFSSS